jgi:uncharacterized membrane-anchored protein
MAADTVLSILVLAALALVLGAIALWRQGGRRQAVLMLILSAIVAGNVALWVMPVQDGRSLASAAPG